VAVVGVLDQFLAVSGIDEWPMKPLNICLVSNKSAQFTSHISIIE